MSSFTPGYAYKLKLNYTNPPKPKYAICVCGKRPLFLLISTEPRTRYNQDSQVQVTPSELLFLTHNSFVNTGESVTMVEPVSGRLLKDYGPIPEGVKQRIIDAIAKSQTLSPRFITLFTTNLS